MKYFTENKQDIEGYMKNLRTLENRLDSETYHFMVNHSFHDSTLDALTVLNEEGPADAKTSPVSVIAQLTDWRGCPYELRWENVSIYSVDFDIIRNKVVETGQVLFERGLDQWSHDELILTVDDCLHHEIMLFSQTKIKIRCKQFSLKNLLSD